MLTGRADQLDDYLAGRLQVFRYDVPGVGVVVWDITGLRARVAADPTAVRLAVQIDPQTMGEIEARNDFDEAHLADVDLSQPGIAAPLIYERREVMYVLVDGTHRCVRAHREGRIFWAQLVTDAVSRAYTISGPEELLPWAYQTAP